MIKNIYKGVKLLSMLGLLVFTFSCTDIEDDDFFTEGGSVLFFKNINPGFYDLGDTDNTFVGFDVLGNGDVISDVVITKSFNGEAGSFGPIQHTTGSLGNYTITLLEALDGFGITADQVVVGDLFTFTATSGTAVRSLNFQASCSSSLEGKYEYTTTNYFCADAGPLTDTVTITEAAAGVYELDDWGFGTYQQCYGSPAAGWGSLQLTDLCNKISVIGLDPFEDSWTITVDSVDGDKLTLTYANTYGEFGTTVLTNPDGDWPPLTN